MIFNFYAHKTHFHNKGFALSPILKMRILELRKVHCHNAPINVNPVGGGGGCAGKGRGFDA